jgi:hypothetical protein
MSARGELCMTATPGCPADVPVLAPSPFDDKCRRRTADSQEWLSHSS